MGASVRLHSRWFLFSFWNLQCQFLVVTLMFLIVVLAFLSMPPLSRKHLPQNEEDFLLSVRVKTKESNAGPQVQHSESSTTVVVPKDSEDVLIKSYTKLSNRENTTLPVIYVVTPTYKRLEQSADMTRLAQTLMHVPSLHWIVVEDAHVYSVSVRDILERTGLGYTHLLGPKPAKYAKGEKEAMPRGVSNRLEGLRWIKENVEDGVLYFADDDNTYDIRVFEEMRWTNKVSMWPVGLVGIFAVSSPILREGQFDGFYDGWIGDRKFAVDMAGFATNIAFLRQSPNATMPFVVGYEEDGFLKSLNLSLSDIEFKANNCTEILVWHTKTVRNRSPTPLNITKYANTNVIQLCETLKQDYYVPQSVNPSPVRTQLSVQQTVDYRELNRKTIMALLICFLVLMLILSMLLFLTSFPVKRKTGANKKPSFSFRTLSVSRRRPPSKSRLNVQYPV